MTKSEKILFVCCFVIFIISYSLPLSFFYWMGSLTGIVWMVIGIKWILKTMKEKFTQFIVETFLLWFLIITLLWISILTTSFFPFIPFSFILTGVILLYVGVLYIVFKYTNWETFQLCGVCSILLFLIGIVQIFSPYMFQELKRKELKLVKAELLWPRTLPFKINAFTVENVNNNNEIIIIISPKDVYRKIHYLMTLNSKGKLKEEVKIEHLPGVINDIKVEDLNEDKVKEVIIKSSIFSYYGKT